MNGFTHLFAVISDGNLVIEGHSNVNETVDLFTVPAEQASNLSALSYFVWDHRFTPFLWTTEADSSPFRTILERTGLAIDAHRNHAA